MPKLFYMGVAVCRSVKMARNVQLLPTPLSLPTSPAARDAAPGPATRAEAEAADEDDAIIPDDMEAALDAAFVAEQAEPLPKVPGTDMPLSMTFMELLMSDDYDLQRIEFHPDYVLSVVPARAPPSRMGTGGGCFDVDALMELM
jgi:hypothetical protein